MAFKIKQNKCTLYLCASQVKLLNDFCYSYTPIPIHLFEEISTPRRICIKCIKKIPNNIVMPFSSKLHVEHKKRGVGGQFLRPIDQELSYIYLPMHIQRPSSKIGYMQIFIISPLKTTFMT